MKDMHLTMGNKHSNCTHSTLFEYLNRFLSRASDYSEEDEKKLRKTAQNEGKSCKEIYTKLKKNTDLALSLVFEADVADKIIAFCTDGATDMTSTWIVRKFKAKYQITMI